MGRELLAHDFVAGQPPMFAGEVVLSRVRGDGTPVEVRHVPSRGHLVRIGDGNSCYVVDGVVGRDDAEHLAVSMPAPSPRTTHTVLSHVCRDPDRGHVVRVESGEAVGAQVGPRRPFPDHPERVAQLSYHSASAYGDPAAEIPIRAFDLRFFAYVYDEKWHSEEYTGRRDGVIRSLWLGDFSDELDDRHVKYVFVRRARRGGGPMPEGAGRDDGPAGTVADPVRSRSDLGPVYGPVEPLARLNVSPPAEANFRYATEPDGAKRAALRRGLTEAAIAAAERRLPVSFEAPPRGPLSFAEFVGTRREYRIGRDDAPYRDPEGVCGHAYAYAQSADGVFDGLVARQEVYEMNDPYRTTSSRFHVELGGRKFVVGTSDVAAALLFLRAQADGDPRVVSARPRLDLEALAATGRHYGYGWSSFAFPDLDGMYLRIRDCGDGFSTAFSPEGERFPTVQAALEASYERFVDAAYGEAPSLRP